MYDCMIKKILIPLAGYDSYEDMLLRYVARAFPSAKLYVVNVINTYGTGIQLTDLLHRELAARAENIINKAKTILHDENMDNLTCEVLEGLPHRIITRYAKKNEVDLIAMYADSTKAAISYYKIGSTVKDVIKHCSTPILIFTEECDRTPIKKILFPTDGTKKTRAARNFAILFSSFYKTEIEALFVMQDEINKKYAEDALENVRWKASFLQVKVKKSFEKGDSIEKILEHSQENDIIVMGIEKRFFLRYYLDAVTQTIVTAPSIPIILVHHVKKE